MKILGTDIYVAYEDSFDLTLTLDKAYDTVKMRFSFDTHNYITDDSKKRTVVFNVGINQTKRIPEKYFYEIIAIDGDRNKTTLVKKSLFVVEETARYAAGNLNTIEYINPL